MRGQGLGEYALVLMMVAVVVVVVLALTTSGDKEDKGVPFPESDGIIQLDWVQVNPPPGFEGRCFAYFHREGGSAYISFGFSGVYCRQ